MEHSQDSGDLRVVAALGQEFERVTERDRQRRRPRALPRLRRLAVVAATALLALAVLTAPGKDATAWMGRLVGIGEVGGSPTQKRHGFEDKAARAAPVVIDNGRAPDGTRYEWVAFRCKVDMRDEGQPNRFRGFGLSLDWPSVRSHEAAGSCAGPREPGERIPAIGSFGVEILPSQFKGVAEPDVVVSGTVNSPAAHRVRIVYSDARGEKRDLPVDFARVGDRLHERAGAGAPRGTFVAFVGGEQAARDRLGDCLDLRALETVAGQNPIERCAALYPAVREFRERLATCHAGVPAPDLAAQRRTERCIGRPPPSPVVAIVYDRHGAELAREDYPFPIPAPHPAPILGKPPYRGQGDAERGKFPVDRDASGRPVVLVSGRTPDGAPFEYFTQKFERRGGEVYSLCLSHWWPYAPGAGASGFCGPGFPTTKEYGKPWPEQLFAKSFGFLESGEPASAYAALEGFARADVAKVRVVYKDGERKRDAPVHFVKVRGDLRERVGSREPFGFFVAFVRPSIERYYGPLGRPSGPLHGPPAIEVIAYDSHDRELSRVGHRN